MWVCHHGASSRRGGGPAHSDCEQIQRNINWWFYPFEIGRGVVKPRARAAEAARPRRAGAPPERLRTGSGPALAAGTVRRRPVMGRRAVVRLAVGRRPMDGRAVVRRARPVVDGRAPPAVPAGRAAPAESAPPRKAALIPARAAPGGIVPAVPPASPDELRLFDRRALRERGGRRRRAEAERGLGGKGELRDQPR